MKRKEIKSEVSGKVWKIEATVGDAIEEDATILIMESMKMEIPISSTEAGRLLEILVKEDESVTEGQAIAVIDMDDV